MARIEGIVEGEIACRRMLSLLRQVVKIEERPRLYSTTKSQIEGKFNLCLPFHIFIWICHQFRQNRCGWEAFFGVEELVLSICLCISVFACYLLLQISICGVNGSATDDEID